jgi:pyruvate,water dikinase
MSATHDDHTDTGSLRELLDAPTYPGWEPGSAPYNIDPVLPFREEDANRFWLLEGHWPRGIVPLGYSCIEDCAWGTQWAAELIPLPTGKGLSARFAGTHVYNSEIPVTSEWEMSRRGEMAGAFLPDRIRDFPDQWAACRDELLVRLDHLESADVDAMSMSELAAYADEAFNFQKWSWEQHFLFMYPLLANYFGLRGLCEELGVDTDLVSKFLQGNDTKIMETDRQIWVLADLAHELDIADLLTGRPSIDALRAEPRAAAWVAALDAFLGEYGWRTDGMADPDLAPWIEDPSTVLSMIASFLTSDRHDFEAAAKAAVDERSAAIDTVRAQLGDEQWSAFEPLLGACQHANFPWWNEEHDFYIDLRTHIPIRRTALALGRLVAADRPDDGVYLFRDELLDIVNGRRDYAELRPHIPARREHRESWKQRRSEMPKIVGNIPDDVADPVLKEIFGMGKEFLDVVRNGVTGRNELTGVAASGGVYRGRVRNLQHAQDLVDLEGDEVLVCEFTSPNWTPAFAIIGACVTDQGGMLSHTATVSREYRVPCVTGVGIATRALHDGDLVEVDGTNGVVRILERASESVDS